MLLTEWAVAVSVVWRTIEPHLQVSVTIQQWHHEWVVVISFSTMLSFAAVSMVAQTSAAMWLADQVQQPVVLRWTWWGKWFWRGIDIVRSSSLCSIRLLIRHQSGAFPQTGYWQHQACAEKRAMIIHCSLLTQLVQKRTWDDKGERICCLPRKYEGNVVAAEVTIAAFFWEGLILSTAWDIWSTGL